MSNLSAAHRHDPASVAGVLRPAKQPRLPHAARLCVMMLAVSIVAGCAAVGPDYVLPQAAVPAAWQTALQAGVTAETSDPQTLARWWSTLNDTDLSALIARAIASNLDGCNRCY